MHKSIPPILAMMAFGFTGCQQLAFKTPLPASAGSYYPKTYGSTWTYRDSIYGEASDTAAGIYGVKVGTRTYTMTSATTDFNSQVCYNVGIASNLNGAGRAYSLAKDHVYALLETDPPFGFTDMQFLVDTASVGYTWESIPSLNTLLQGSPVRCINIVLEKDISRTVNGQTYTNVYHTAINYQINLNGSGFNNIAYFDFYVALGIGIIEKDAYYYGDLNETETLVNYSVK
jgi:hypothetical protein